MKKDRKRREFCFTGHTLRVAEYWILLNNPNFQKEN